MEKIILYYKGKNIYDMSKDELIEALKNAIDIINRKYNE